MNHQAASHPQRSNRTAPALAGLLAATTAALAAALPAQRQFDSLGRLPAADATCVVLQDVDRDGDLDVYLGNSTRGHLLYLNDGGGRFTDFSATRLPSLYSATVAAAFADFDGDGDPDLVCSGVGTKTLLHLYLNNGRGKFTDATAAQLPVHANTIPLALATGDVDRDGDQDIVIANDGQNRLFINDGRGTFTDATGRMPADNRRAEAVALVDVDGDRDLDLVFGNKRYQTADGQNLLYLNDGAGKFTDVTQTRMPALSDQTVDLATADVDGDGDPDLVFGTEDGQNRLYFNNGKGAFTDVTATHLPAHDEPTYAVALVDVDGDGDQDLVCGNRYDPYRLAGHNRLYLNIGQGRFFERTFERLPGDRADTAAMGVGDLDGDGAPDLVIGNHRSRSRIYRNRGKGFFTNLAPPDALPKLGSRVLGIATGDVDGDGTSDLVILSPTVKLYVNHGGGSFVDESARRLPMRLTSSICAALADVDGDGDLDLLLGNSGPNRLLLNDGRGFFTDATAWLPVDGDATMDIALGDVDGDGDPDLICGNDGTQSRLYRNDGRGRFTDVTAGQMPQLTFFASSIGLADVDGDGDLDLAFGNMGQSTWSGRVGGQNRLYFNDGRGTFQDVTASHLPVVRGPTIALVFGDFDGDGDPDMYCGNGWTTLAHLLVNRLYLNDGKGSFVDVSATRIPQLLQPTQDVMAGDVDGDGDLDLVLTLGDDDPRQGRHEYPNALYLNDGRGTFSDASSKLPAFSRVTHAGALVDVDGDLDLDLVIPEDPGGVYLNLQRHLQAPIELRLGEPYDLDVYARYGPPSATTIALPFVSAAASRIWLPPLGFVGLDPAYLVALPPIRVPASTGVGSLRLAIPKGRAWRGFRVFAQALVLRGPHAPGLTNPVADVVR